MAYETIGDTEVDAESPLIESLFQRLRDNIIAIPAGDNSIDTPPYVSAGAIDTGQITYAKFATNAVQTAHIVDGAVTEAKLSSVISAKLVTNGNNHDHYGGDGASLVNGSFQNEIFYTSHIYKSSIQRSATSILPSTRYVLPNVGFWLCTVGPGSFSPQDHVKIQLYITSGAYTGWQGNDGPAGLVWADGSYVAIYNDDPTNSQEWSYSRLYP